MNIKHFYAILSTPSESHATEAMQDEIYFILKKIPGVTIQTDAMGNTYATKGTADTYPCAVCHIDTVHPIVGEITPIEINGKITGFDAATMRQVGIGGDDKCGIWACIQLLDSLPAMKAAFFVDEEVGCMGSLRAEMNFFDNVRFVLQADRRGNSDFVTDIMGGLSSKAFQKSVSPFLQKHGYKKCHGGMTDVMQLRDNGLKISTANISAGYYHPHTPQEFIVVADLERTIALMRDICESLHATYPFTPRPKQYHKWPLPAPKSISTADPLSEVWADWEKKPATLPEDDEWEKRWADNNGDDYSPSDRLAEYEMEKARGNYLGFYNLP